MRQATDSLNYAPSKLRLRPLDSSERERHASGYLYGHFFIVASVVALGIGVEHAVKETGNYSQLKFSTLALLCGSIAVYLAIITAIRFAVGTCHLLYPRLASIAAALMILTFGGSLSPLLVLSLLFLLLVGGVILETVFDEEAKDEETFEHLKSCEHAG
ncbi:MAG: low temperature requirement protein A [Pyrinomonadaceae bacterium]